MIGLFLIVDYESIVIVYDGFGFGGCGNSVGLIIVVGGNGDVIEIVVC